MAEEPTYHLLGPAGSLEFAQVEILGEMLMRNLPNVSCRIDRVHPTEWRAHAAEVRARAAALRSLR
jgi:hypothetical protein